MKKQTLFAAPLLAAVTFVCQPMLADDKAIDTAAGNQSRLAQPGQTGDASAAPDVKSDPVRAIGNGDNVNAQVAGAREVGNMDQKCVMHIADVNNFEIRAGQLAQDRAQNEEIKRFAKMMVDDHTQAQQQLQQIAQQKGWTISEQLMPVHQAKLDMLNKVEGRDFDRAYLYGQVGGHTETALWLRDAKGEAQDNDLKQYVASILPKVQQHLKHGQQMANADEATTAGARIGRDSDDVVRPGKGVTDGEVTTPRSAENTGAGRPERGAAPAPGVAPDAAR